jgi:hypothetical protein
MIYLCKTQHLGRRLDLVDQVVDALVIGRMSQPDAARLLAPEVDVDGLRRDATDIRGRRDALAALLAENLLGIDAVREQSARLSATLADVERRIEHASGSSPLAPLIGADDVAATWQAMALLARRDSIRVLFDSITVLPVTRGARFDPSQIVPVWR